MAAFAVPAIVVASTAVLVALIPWSRAVNTVTPPEALTSLAFAVVASVTDAITLLALMELALKFPLASRFTIAFDVLLVSGATFQVNPKVPDLVIGDPATTKSVAGAESPTLLTGPGGPAGPAGPAAPVNTISSSGA